MYNFINKNVWLTRRSSSGAAASRENTITAVRVTKAKRGRGKVEGIRKKETVIRIQNQKRRGHEKARLGFKRFTFRVGKVS